MRLRTEAPHFDSLTKTLNPADPRQVVEAIARRDQIRVLLYGMTAANGFGLTNAVPANTARVSFGLYMQRRYSLSSRWLSAC